MTTFAEHLINNILPEGVQVTKPVDKDYMEDLLVEVSNKAPQQYSRVVSDLKKLGDNVSTWDATSFGLDEISVPDKKKRDQVIRKYQGLTSKEKDSTKKMTHLVDLQNELAELNLPANAKDDASTMIRSAMGGKKNQLMKLRTSPGVVMGADGSIHPEIFPTSYAEGVDPLQYWLGAAESRRNLVQGQVSTSEPGELSKVISNVLNRSVVSEEDCGTRRGIELLTRDEDIVGRYLAASTGGYSANTKVTSDVQQELLKKKISKVMVRSPQTCQSREQTVCSKCMGVRPGTGKDYQIGDNAGMITAGSLAEPLTQMALSAKHSTAMAGQTKGLAGSKGFRQFAEMPETFPGKKILSEIYGKITNIQKAPQGGQIITIQKTGDVPTRYIEQGMRSKAGQDHYDYFIPPDAEILSGIASGTEVHPGMELTDGADNVRDVARLRNLGSARSAAAQGMYDVYKNSGFKQSRSHFELLARNAHPYVKMEKAPADFEFKRGEVVDYNRLENSMGTVKQSKKAVADAIGEVLAEGVLDVTAGTEITPQLADRLISSGVQSVKSTKDIEVSPATTPLTRSVNRSDDWIANMNHRHLKDQIKDAASYGKRSTLHGYSPITSYAYGTEMTQDEHGRY